MKNYYKIFGLRITATDADIKQAYRQLAKALHPDLNRDNPEAEKQLADVNEAYEVLSDPVKRAEYNKSINSTIIKTQRKPGDAYSQSNSNPGYHSTSSRFDQMAAQAAAAQAAQAAQIEAAVKKAYSDGYTKGFKDSTAKSSNEAAQLKSDIVTLKNKVNDLLKELEYADKDYQTISDKYTDLLARHTMLEQENDEANEKSAQSPSTEMTTMLSRLKEDNDRAKTKLNAMIDAAVQKDIEIDKLKAELSSVKEQLAEYEEYVQVQDQKEDIERIILERQLKLKAEKKEFKDTYYGVLGLNYWSTQAEIKQNYDKLLKRLKLKADKGDEVAKEKIKNLNAAVMVLYDDNQRIEYNKTLKITEEDISRERLLEEEYNKLVEKYELSKEEEEFWESVDEMMMLAQSGDSEAQNSLGLLYYDGDRLEQDLAQAVYWFKEAAKQHNVEALYNLGLCFYYGEGIEKDTIKGEGFIKQAAKLGHAEAKDFLKPTN